MGGGPRAGGGANGSVKGLILGPSTWWPPPHGKLKINIVDVVVPQVDMMGFGFVMRDANGSVLVSGASKHRRSLSVAIGEALALRWAMQVSFDLGHRVLIFVSNSMVVCSA